MAKAIVASLFLGFRGGGIDGLLGEFHVVGSLCLDRRGARAVATGGRNLGFAGLKIPNSPSRATNRAAPKSTRWIWPAMRRPSGSLATTGRIQRRRHPEASACWFLGLGEISSTGRLSLRTASSSARVPMAPAGQAVSSGPARLTQLGGVRGKGLTHGGVDLILIKFSSVGQVARSGAMCRSPAAPARPAT